MSNNYFQFKQFRIQQDRCAMKVSTDGILLGAWADGTGATHALDVGTGTGILALMLAQRFSALAIEAIEIDKEAFTQASENVDHSRWKERIVLQHTMLQAWKTDKVYELIICNPPYFEPASEVSGKARQLARHQVGLSYSELLHFSRDHLNEKGKLSMILPAGNHKEVSAEAHELGLFLQRETTVKYKLEKDVSRYLIELGRKKPKKLHRDELLIQEGGTNQYSQDFIDLTREFYAFMD